MNHSVTPFAFEDKLIRTLRHEGEPWFVATDVCAVLEIANSRDAISKLDDDEKGVGITDTLGGPQESNIISESGLYALAFRSRKPEARRFRKWVTNEVLPQIRRTGSYGALRPRQAAYLTLVRELIGIGVPPAAAARGALRIETTEAKTFGREKPPEIATTHPVDILLDLLEPDREYRMADLIALFPPTHPIAKEKNPRARDTRVGIRLEELCRAGKLIRVPARYATFRLPAKDNIIEIPR